MIQKHDLPILEYDFDSIEVIRPNHGAEQLVLPEEGCGEGLLIVHQVPNAQDDMVGLDGFDVGQFLDEGRHVGDGRLQVAVVDLCVGHLPKLGDMTGRQLMGGDRKDEFFGVHVWGNLLFGWLIVAFYRSSEATCVADLAKRSMWQG